MFLFEEQEKLFEAELTDEAEEQLYELDMIYQDKIVAAIRAFEQLGRI